MLPRLRRVFARIARAGWPVPLLLLFPVCLFGQQHESRVVCLEGVDHREREELAHKLQKVTGWPDLRFDHSGRLRHGILQPVGGSPRARYLVTQAMTGDNTIVLEETNRHPDVVFSRVLPAKWKDETPNSPSVYVIQIDFSDFKHVTGDRDAMQAFHLGWVVLHELDHIVNNSFDVNYSGETGECEEHINLMRRECNLPERGDYFFTFLPTASDSVFAARFVRLAFEKELAGTRRKYWLVWDANLVGGLSEKQIASLR